MVTGTSGCARAAAAAQRWKAGPCGGLCSCGGSTLQPGAVPGRNPAAAQPALQQTQGFNSPNTWQGREQV